MARNTVDFDDLLASLDDLTTTPAAPAEEEHHHHHHHYEEPAVEADLTFSSDFSAPSHHETHHHHEPAYDIPVEEELSFSAPPPPPPVEEDIYVPPPPPPVVHSAPVVKKVSPAPAKAFAKPAPAANPFGAQLKPAANRSAPSNNTPSRAAPPPSSGDMRNYARQSEVVRPGQHSKVGSANERCHKCGQHFEGEYISALNKSFHTHHFQCNDCGKQLGGSFFDHRGSPLCSDCAGKLLPCKKCGRGITGQYMIQDGKPMHKECIDRWVCARCHREVDDVVTTALGKQWHKHCFTCFSCNTALGGQFVSKDGNPICHNCSQKSMPKCTVCHRELVGDYTNFEGKGFHNECFKCNRCQTKLQLSGFYNVNGQTLCERCVR